MVDLPRSAVLIIACIWFVWASVAAAEEGPSIFGSRSTQTATSTDHGVAIAVGSHSTIVILLGGKEMTFPQDNAYQIAQAFIPNNVDEIRTVLKDESPTLVGLVAMANYAFHTQDYSTAAGLYRRALALVDVKNPFYNPILGMVTAGYFGSGAHEEGLHFICDMYKFFPKGDYRFRHVIHAHIRVLAYRKGFKYAEGVIDDLRTQPSCRRDDFTYAWIPFPLENMRLLEKSLAPVGTVSTIREEDANYMKMLVKTPEKYGFIDYVYYFLGQYDEIIDNFQHSYIYDMAILAKAESLTVKADQDGQAQAIRYLKLYAERYPRGPRIDYVKKLTVKYLLDTNQLKEATQLIAENKSVFTEDKTVVRTVRLGKGNYTSDMREYKDYYDEHFAYRYEFRSHCEELVGWFQEGQFEKLRDFFARYDALFVDLYGNDYDLGTDIQKLSPEQRDCYSAQIERRNVLKIINITSSLPSLRDNERLDGKKLYDAAVQLKKCGDETQNGINIKYKTTKFEEFCEPLLVTLPGWQTGRLSFHDLSAKMFEVVYKLDRERWHAALFLEALCYKNQKRYEKYLERMREYVINHPDKELADDGYADMGQYYLGIVGERGMAERQFLRVIEGYKGRNAYDNALNWLVILYRQQGQYVDAIKYGAMLAKEVLSDRLRAKNLGRQKRIEALSTNVKSVQTADIKVATAWGSALQIWGTNSEEVSLLPMALPPVVEVVSCRGEFCKCVGKGMEITKVGGVSVVDVDELFRILREHYQRGDGKVRVNTSGPVGPEDFRSCEKDVPISAFGEF